MVSSPKYSPALLTSAFLPPIFLKPEKTSPIQFGKTHWRESCVDPIWVQREGKNEEEYIFANRGDRDYGLSFHARS
jgi:hypothetical protein